MSFDLIMNLANSLQFLDPVQEHVSRIYSTTSEIITILLILWCLNFIAGLIQKTFASGQAFGRFYYAYLHRHFKKAFKGIQSIIINNKKDIDGNQNTSYLARPVSWLIPK